MDAARGFTLLEMMITVTIAGILLAVAIPSYQNIIGNSRLAAQANTLVNALTQARSEALKRGLPVTVCAAVGDPELTSTPSCTTSTSAGWANGWIVYEEGAGNIGTYDASGATIALGTVLSDSVRNAADNLVLPRGTTITTSPSITTTADTMLSFGAAIRGDNSLTGSSPVAKRITYSADGLPNIVGGTFTICDGQRSGYSRKIVVSTTGRIRTERHDGDDADC
jgi:type IV fimbrial biogenesis protein FimT